MWLVRLKELEIQLQNSFENHKVNFRRQRWEITKGGFQKLQDLEIDFDEGRCLGKPRVHMIYLGIYDLEMMI